jgi:apolipoprotein N-acyltransferase
VGDRAARLTLAAAFALGLAAAFPFRAGEVRFDLGAVAGWLALVPFARLLRGLRPRAAFAWATGATTVAYAAILWWIFVVVHVHGHAAAWVAVLAVWALALYVGLHVGAASALAAALEPRAGRLAFLVLPAAWVLAEALRTLDPGFPWAFLGYSMQPSPPVRRLASLGGVYGLSFLLAATASLAARGAWRSALAVALGAHALGLALGALAPPPADGADAPRAGLVQASIPQDQKWDQTLAGAAFAAHLETSREAARSGPLDLLVWPEASVPVFLQLDVEYRDQLLELAREIGAPIVLGGMGVEADPERRAYRYFNSAFAIDLASDWSERYDKARLVPFGEYVPFRWLFGFLPALATGIASADVTPGPGPRTLVAPSLGPDHAMAPLICYEVIYPGLVREAVRGGARLLLNVTNDAWYDRSSAPHQFLAIAAMRSAELGVPMLRAANTGVSAIIDANGDVRAETPLFERRALVGAVPRPRDGATPYARLGDWVLAACAALLIGIGGVGFVGRQRAGAGSRGSARQAR